MKRLFTLQTSRLSLVVLLNSTSLLRSINLWRSEVKVRSEFFSSDFLSFSRKSWTISGWSVSTAWTKDDTSGLVCLHNNCKMTKVYVKVFLIIMSALKLHIRIFLTNFYQLEVSIRVGSIGRDSIVLFTQCRHMNPDQL